MPTVLRHDGYRVMIYTDDHEPAHVHVYRAEFAATYLLNCPDGPPTLRTNQNFTLTEVNKILKWLTTETQYLCDQWRAIDDNRG